MKTKWRQRWAYLGLLVISLAALSSGNVATANSSPSSNEIRVSPVLSNIQLSPGETSTTVMATVTNLTSVPLSVNLSTRDFGASPVSADSISFYGNNYNPATNPHGLQSTISFNGSQVTLAPHASDKVPIILNNLDKLAPGGHYGSVLFSPVTPGANGKNSKVSIRSAVASLLFLTTATGGTQDLSLSQFPVGHLQFSLPSTSYVALKNTGNTQTAPIGQLTLYNPSGKITSTTVLNPGSGLILPDTTRLFTVALPLPHATFARPGMYRLQLQYRDSAEGKFVTINKKFFLVNFWVIIPWIIIIFLVWFMVRHRRKQVMHLTHRLLGSIWHMVRRKKTPPVPPKPKQPPLIQG